jgi:threonine dehydrogenase-like Zn-dependent dehydrogenase
VLGTFHATPLHFRRALNLIASRTIDVKRLVTRKMRLEQIKEAFEILSTSKSEIKIGILP